MGLQITNKKVTKYIPEKDEKEVVIPEGVKEIGVEAFSGADNLESIVLPDGLKKIMKRAFWNCTKLKKIHIPGTVESIGIESFLSCKALKEVVIEEGITKINYRAFFSCASLEKINIPASVSVLDQDILGECSSIKEVVVYDGNINDDKFMISRLGWVVPYTIKSSETDKAYLKIKRDYFDWDFWKSAFQKLSLTIKKIDKDFASIKDGRYKYWTAAARLEYPYELSADAEKQYKEYLSKQKKKALEYYCADKNFSAVKLMDKLGYINKNNILECIDIAEKNGSIEIQEYLTEYKDKNISSKAIEKAEQDKNEKAKLAKEKEDKVVSLAELQKMFDYIIKDDNIIITKGRNRRQVILPEKIEGGLKITKISGFAYLGANKLESLVIPEGVKCICNQAFRGCGSLKSVSLPNSLETIEQYVFSNCSSLSEITIPASVTKIEKDAFGSAVTEGGKVDKYEWADITIKVTAGSYAEKYAKQNNLKFEVIE